ncbi:MAG: viroplasmin family protein [Lachnospiraceae bacterium]
MGKKYYAVAKGKTPGIYFTWEDCKVQVDQFSGAVYKSFPTMDEAEAFIRAVRGEDCENLKNTNTDSSSRCERSSAVETGQQEDIPVSTKTHLIAYVDGSYEHSRKQYAYGCVLVLKDQLVTLNGSGNDEEYVTMRNVAGEILGSEQAVTWAVEHGYEAITIYYDYEGIEKWANGIWKANKTGTQRYKAFIAEKREKIDIFFCKVAAHTGVKYNEMADQLAKEALGL